MRRFSPFEESLWHATAAPAPALGRLEGATTADVCVVGGGYSGLTTALALAQAGADVVLLEAEEIGFGGSGRNAGHCTPTFHHHSIAGVRRLLGAERGARFIALQTRAADRVAALIRENAIDCEWCQTGYVMAAHTPSALPRLEAKAEEYNAVGCDTRVLTRDETAAMTGMEPQHGGWFHPEGGHLNPLGFSRGLARAVLGAGGRILVRSTVTGLERSGARWRVATPAGAVLAEKVVLATGAYTRQGWPGLDRTFRIMRVFVAATEPLPALRDVVLPRNTTAHDGHGDIFVYKRDAADRLVVSMFPNLWRGRDRARTFDLLTRRLRWLHPQMPAKIRWHHLWTGELDMQRRTIPRLYGLAPGVVAATGLSGRGVPTGCVLGSILSDWALGAAEAGLALPIEPLRRAPLHMSIAPQIMLRYHAIRDRLAERRDGAPSPPRS